MNAWQWAVVAIVAAGCLTPMVAAILRMFSRQSSGAAAIERRGSALESGLLGPEETEGVRAFDTWSYRVSARFAGKCRVVIHGETVSVCGPRVPSGLYRTWIWAQGLTLALVPAVLVAGIVTLDWRLALIGVLTLIASFGISAGGAGLWPGLGEMEYVSFGAYKALEFRRSDARDVAIGEGWARGGMDVVLLPYKKPVDQMAKGRAVSFFGPDERGREVRFALHCLSDEDAQALAGLLESGASEATA